MLLGSLPFCKGEPENKSICPCHYNGIDAALQRAGGEEVAGTVRMFIGLLTGMYVPPPPMHTHTCTLLVYH